MVTSRLWWMVLLSLTLFACDDPLPAEPAVVESNAESEDEDGAMGQATEAVCATGSTLTYETFAKPFFANYCVSCHASDLTDRERMDAPTDHNLDTLDGILDGIEHVAAAAAAGPMVINTSMPPRGNPMPSVSERRQLGEWIACGAP